MLTSIIKIMFTSFKINIIYTWKMRTKSIITKKNRIIFFRFSFALERFSTVWTKKSKRLFMRGGCVGPTGTKKSKRLFMRGRESAYPYLGRGSNLVWINKIPKRFSVRNNKWYFWGRTLQIVNRDSPSILISTVHFQLLFWFLFE